jgi:hypothetical protein
MQKKPTQPQGSGPLEVWLRTLLLPYIYSLELTSVVGLRKIANPSGGYALVKDSETKGGPSGSLSYEGEWVASRGYIKDNIVRVTVVPAEPAAGVNYTGLFIARTTVPAGVRPVYPETANPYWELWSLGVREINVADTLVGSRKMLTSCGDPYSY